MEKSDAIVINSISKRYRIGLDDIEHDTFISKIISIIKSPISNFRKLHSLSHFNDNDENIFWALKDITFSMKSGDVLGVIGHNGAGKSTLLKILSKITEPTHGQIILNGRVASLLEVGTGFHPDLTGKENIFLNGTILGMKEKEIDKKFDDIVNFSGIDKYLHTPVKRYSSGMRVRLAFSVAAFLDPEILLVDEVLAVGDAEFQKKCLGKMGDIAVSGKSIIFVSHNMAAIRSLCNKAIVLNNGRLEFIGDVDKSIDYYLNQKNILSTISLKDRTDRTGNQKLKVQEILMLDKDNNQIKSAVSGELVKIRLIYELREKSLNNVFIGMNFIDEYGLTLFQCNTDLVNENFIEISSDGAFTCVIPKLPLLEGSYSVFVSIKENRLDSLDRINNAFTFNVVNGDFFSSGKMPEKKVGSFLVEHNWEKT